MVTLRKNICRVLWTPPFDLPNVRSGTDGKKVHAGVVGPGRHLFAACHAETAKITAATPTTDGITCDNCLNRRRKGQLPPKQGFSIPPHLAEPALAICRKVFPKDAWKALANDFYTRHRQIRNGVPGATPQLGIPDSLVEEWRCLFTQYQHIEDLPTVTELAKEIVAKMYAIAVGPAGQSRMAA